MSGLPLEVPASIESRNRDRTIRRFSPRYPHFYGCYLCHHGTLVPHDGRVSDETESVRPPQSWLELLADERPVTEFESYRRRRLAEAPESEHENLEAQAEHVLQIRARLAERKQHGDELTVLNDLARRLASLRDPHEVLQEVANQARRLLAVDVAYIMLLQKDGRLRIDVEDGSMGSILRGIELDSGSGLGGEVLRAGRPLWSEIYLEDTRFPHVRSVDNVARSEQLGGILGVPLFVGDETIGVLLAADRRPRRFTGREIELLASLASHAAVAIRNASLFEQHRTAAGELQEANTTLRRTNDIRQRAIELRDNLTNVVIRGGGFAEIASELERAIDAPVTVFGSRDEHLAGPDLDIALPLLAPGVVGRASFEDFLTPSPRRFDISHGKGVVAPVLLRSGYAGCLVAIAPAAVDNEAVHLLTIGATSVALVIASEHSLVEAELRTRGEFVNALLSPDTDEASIRRRARSTGIDIDGISAVAVLDPGRGEPQEAAQLASRLAGELGGWSADHADHIVVLLPGATPVTVKERIERLFDGQLPCAIGIAPCVGGSREVRASHEVARQTATVLHALGRSTDCVQASELGVYRSLFSQSGRDEITSFIELTLGPLLTHDQERQSDLARTLSTYLAQSRHHSRTCGLLHIHANTLYQRLDRVTQLIGPRWKEPERGLEVQLALRLHELLVTLSPMTRP